MKPIITTILAAVLVAILAAGAQTKGEVERMFKAAKNAELVDGDLKAAIERYDTIVAKYSKSDRAASANALVLMAECYTKLGDAQARKIYERVVQDYSDQKEAAAVARARLGGANPPRPEVATALYGPAPMSTSLERSHRTAAILAMSTGTTATSCCVIWSTAPITLSPRRSRGRIKTGRSVPIRRFHETENT